jgi:hypothetical protein
VRDALDRARSYRDAVARLSAAPLLAPAILAVAGATAGEACVVERTAGAAEVRRLEGGRLCATNHALSAALEGRSIDYDAGSSVARLAALSAGRRPGTVRAALAALAPTVREGLTQHQVVMRAADGLLVVRVPGQRARRFRLRS